MIRHLDDFAKAVDVPGLFRRSRTAAEKSFRVRTSPPAQNTV